MNTLLQIRFKFLKNYFSNFSPKLIMLFLLLFPFLNEEIAAQTTVSYTTAGTYTWICPQGVTSVTITCIGGGGAGGGSSNADRNGGGGGGGASVTLSNYTVVPGGSYTVVVGAAGTGVSANTGGSGTASSVSYLSSIFIKADFGIGGQRGANSTSAGAGGLGGIIANNIPANTGFKGGNGGNSDATTTAADRSGGGGGGAGVTGPGGNAPNASGSAGAAGAAGSGGYGGAGGAGVSSTAGSGANGNPGAVYGGGGGGSTTYNSGTRAGANGANGAVIITIPCAAPVAPTAISGTTTICPSSTTTVTASGGTTGNQGIYYWYSGGCPTNAFAQHWTGNSIVYGAAATTINSTTGGLINLTSTSNDPNIDMTGLGSFAPATFKYINVRFRVTSVAQVTGMEIFWYNTLYTGANGAQMKSQPITSVQNVWQTVSINMSAPSAGNWLHSNVTGWRFDWAVNSGVTMEIDFVSLSSQPIVGEGAAFTTGTAGTYYSAIQNACGLTTCQSVTLTNSAASAVGAVSANQNICIGDQPANMTIASATGTIQWQQADNAGFTVGLANLGTNSTTLTSAQVGGLSSTKYFRAVVTNNGCTAATSGTITVTANTCGSPTVTSFTPVSACTGSAAVITISGTNLAGSTVTINGVTATVTSSNSTTVVCTLPAGATGSGNVVVTTTGGSASLGTFTVNPIATLDGITVSSPCWITSGSNDYQITVKATGNSPTAFDGSTYGLLALINYQGAHTSSPGGYYAWNSTLAGLTAQGYTQNQVACTGGGFVGMYAAAYGATTATLIGGTTSVSGNQRTVTFTIRPNATFPNFTDNSVSQFAATLPGNCNAGWTETANLFSSSPAIPTNGTVSVNGDSNPANLVQICIGETIAVGQSGFNNQGGVTYAFADNTTAFGGWTELPYWEIINYGGITPANQVAGQTNVNGLANYNFKINTAGIYVLHHNAAFGQCYAPGVNRYINVNDLPVTPTTPTSNSPQCASPGVTLTRVAPPAGFTWYWQTTANGTSTANSGVTNVVNAAGTYYLRAQNNTTLCWSAASASVVVAISPGPPVVATPSPTNGNSAVCYAGTGAISSISWAASAGATGYDVYFGTSTNPPLVSTNQAGLSYSVGTLNVATTYYWRIVPKNSCNFTDPGTNWSFTTANTPCGYCTPSFSGNDASGITNVIFNTINNASVTNGSQYTDFTSTVFTAVNQGSAYTLTVNVNTGGSYDCYAKAWFDWNMNGVFESNEAYNLGYANSVTNSATSVTPSITIPLVNSGNGGSIRMRIGSNYSSSIGDGNACGTFNYAESEDYRIVINPAPACSGTPTSGSSTPTTQNIASGNSAVISLSGTTLATNLTFQWQTSSTAGGTYTNVVGGSGANTNTYTTPAITAEAYYYRCVVTCANSGSSSTSSVAEVLRDYCTPYSEPNFLTYNYISNFSTTLCPTNINNTTPAPSIFSTYYGYTNYSSLIASQYQSLNVNYSITTTSVRGIALWVDWNNDDLFSPSELINSVGSATANQTSMTGTFTIPAGQSPGNYRVRVLCDLNRNFNATTPNPCSFGVVPAGGEAEDYTLTVLNYPTCSGAPTPGNVLVPINPACIGTNTTLNAQNQVVQNGLTYQWQSSDDGVNWTDIPTQNTDFYYARGFKIDITVNDYIKKYRCKVDCSGNTVYTPVLILLAQQCFPTSGTATTPAAFSCVRMSVWGAGGGGGGARATIGNDARAGGGGGGGFSSSIQSVNPSDIITITIGAGGAGGLAANPPTDGSDGNPSKMSINGTDLVTANGGIGGRFRSNGTNGVKVGTGGTGITTNGGNGGPTNGTDASGGGGGAGTIANGSNGTASSAGAGGQYGGGAGGTFRTSNGTGFVGNAPGGGGGGARATTLGTATQAGGGGGAGYATIEFPLTIEKGTITNSNFAASPISLCPGGTVSSNGGGSPAVSFGSVTYLWRIGERLGVGDYNFGNWQTIGTGASISGIDPSTYFPTSTELLVVRSVVSSCGALGWPTSATQDHYIWVNVSVANADITSSSASNCPGGAFTVSGTITATGSWTLTLSDGNTVTGNGSGTWSTTLNPSSTTVYTLSSMSGATCAASAILTGTSTATVSTASPSSVASATGATLAPGDLLWSGNSSTAWGSNTNWYAFDGIAFVVPGSGIAPTANDRVFVLPSSTSGICISATNNTTITAAGTAKDVFIGTGATMLINAGQILQVNGNWTNNGTFTPNATATVEFVGGTAQTLGGSSANNFTNLTLNKSANMLTLNTPVNVSGTLTMTGGNIATSGSLLTVGTSPAAPGSVAWTGGTVVGPLRRYFSGTASGTQASGIFPVGLSGLNRYAQVNYTSGLSTGGTITAEYKAGICPVGSNGIPADINGQVIDNFEDEGYWEITPIGGNLNAATYSLILRGNTLSSVTSPADMSELRLIKSVTHTTWDNTGVGSHSAPVGGVSDFTISNSGMTGFSFFNIGSGNANPLPVTLLNFAANCNEKLNVDVKWTTASEQNSEIFTVERSRDLAQWEFVTNINAAGNSNYNINYATADADAFGGVSYYRLVQTDINGAESIYGPISVSCSEDGNSMIVFPNPTNGAFTVEIYSNESLNQAELHVTDLSGKVIGLKIVDIQKGKNQVYFEDLGLQLGTYIIDVTSTTNQIIPVKMVVN